MKVAIFQWMLCGIYTGANILVKHTASHFYSEDGGSRFVQNMFTFVQAILT